MTIPLLIIAGLILGSFTSALVWRIHEQSKPKSKRALPDKQLSMLHGRSVCPSCKHVLAPNDLIPLISWLWLRGRCRYCKQPIADTPLPEVTLAASFAVSYMAWPYGFAATGMVFFGVWLASLTAFAALILYDIRWMLLPNRIVYPLIAVSGLHVIVQVVLSDVSPVSLLARAVGSAAIGGGLFYLLFQISDGKWIGGGDVKLGFALGFLLMRPDLALLMLFVASLLGVVYSVPLMAAKRLHSASRVPFGPFLMLATAIVVLWGGQFVTWYIETSSTIFLP